jgi:hypothetical protein
MRSERQVTFSFESRILFFWVSAILVSSVINFIFLSEINSLASGIQNQYLIDGYYYLHLGQEAMLIADRDGVSLYKAAESIRPNISSSGIVFLSSLTSSIVPWPWLVPAFFACIYAALVVALSRSYRIESNFYLLFFSGLVPYLYIPTKEAFFTIGLILALVCIRRSALMILLPLAAGIMYQARPEALFILAASVTAYLLLRRWSRMKLVLLLVLVLGIYWTVLREMVAATSILFQLAAETVDAGFCKVGPLSVCLPDGGPAEHIYLQRLLSLLGLPLKWLADIFQLIAGDTMPPSAWILRLAQGMQLVAIGIVLRQRFRSRRPLDTTQVTLLVFACLYISIYSMVLYYQVTRQALLSMHFVLLALLISESPRVRSRRFRFQVLARNDPRPVPQSH